MEAPRSYKLLLNDVSKLLTVEKVQELAFLLDLDPSIQCQTGVQLFKVLEAASHLAEDNLTELKAALKGVNLIKAFNLVESFEAFRTHEASSKGQSDLSQSWPASNFASQTHKPRTLSEASFQAYATQDHNGPSSNGYNRAPSYPQPGHSNGQRGGPQMTPWANQYQSTPGHMQPPSHFHGDARYPALSHQQQQYPLAEFPQGGYSGPQQGPQGTHQSYKDPQIGYMGPQHGYTDPQQGHQSTQQGYTGPPQGHQSTQQGYTGPPQGHQSTQQGYTGPPQVHQGTQQGYTGPPQGHQSTQQGYTGPPQVHQGTQQGYTGPPQGHQSTQQGYTGPPQGHQSTQQGYTGPPQGHQSTQQGYTGPPQVHQGTQQGYTGPPQGHQSTQQGYTGPPQVHQSTQQGYTVPQQGHQGPQQGHSDSQQGGMGPQQGCLDTQDWQRNPQGDCPSTQLSASAGRPSRMLSNPGSLVEPPTKHRLVSAVKSSPSALCVDTKTDNSPDPEPDPEPDPVVELEPESEVKLKKEPVPSTDVAGSICKSMNIPPENKAENVITKPQPQPQPQPQPLRGTSLQTSAGNAKPAKREGGGVMKDTAMYQTGRVRANSEENNSIAVATQPISEMNQSDAETMLISRMTSMKLYDCHKVERISEGPYQVRIPEGTHYMTSEGAYVLLPFGSDYAIQLFNNNKQLRCSAQITYDGGFAGEWAIDAIDTITLKRPATEDRKFHFVPTSHPAQRSEDGQVEPDSGLIRVEFCPEQVTSDPWNDVSRGFGMADTGPLDTYAGLFADQGDVQRSCLPPPDQCWQPGRSILGDQSGQTFQLSEHFTVDDRLKKVIQIKLVGK